MSNEATIRIGLCIGKIFAALQFLLATPPTDLERALFIDRRIAEERAGEVRRLAARRSQAGTHRNAPFRAAITADGRATSG